MGCEVGPATTDVKEAEKDIREDSAFLTEEIEIEEMAIDGICGVY